MGRTATNKKASGYVPVTNNLAWLEWIVPERFNDSELFRIVTFFVFHSPCVGKKPNSKPPSAMHKPVSDYGWSEKWSNYRNPQSLNNILRNASTNFSLIFSATGNNDMKQACQKADLLDDFPSDIQRERIAISLNDRNQFLSVFRHIRNVFSHSRLNMRELADGDFAFILEDVSSGGKNVSARMILRKSTLIKWIDIIQAGPKAGNEEEK